MSDDKFHRDCTRNGYPVTGGFPHIDTGTAAYGRTAGSPVHYGPFPQNLPKNGPQIECISSGNSTTARCRLPMFHRLSFYRRNESRKACARQSRQTERNRAVAAPSAKRQAGRFAVLLSSENAPEINIAPATCVQQTGSLAHTHTHTVRKRHG